MNRGWGFEELEEAIRAEVFSVERLEHTGTVSQELSGRHGRFRLISRCLRITAMTMSRTADQPSSTCRRSMKGK